MTRGVIQKWRGSNGYYGFIVSSGPDVFVHGKVLEAAGIDTSDTGTVNGVKVSYEIGVRGDAKTYAKVVRRLEDA